VVADTDRLDPDQHLSGAEAVRGGSRDLLEDEVLGGTELPQDDRPHRRHHRGLLLPEREKP
jgi:hypothetical protein